MRNKSVNPFQNYKFCTLPNSKEFEDDNLRFDENGRQFSKSVENTVEKVEIACNEHFLFFQVFSIDFTDT